MSPKRVCAAAALLCLSLTAPGCGSSTYYSWGNYQDHLYNLFLESEDMDPADEIGQLVELIERAGHGDKPVPPGVRAHLGFLYYRVGNEVESMRWLEAEKAAYPEATVFVNGMQARMRKQGSSKPQQPGKQG